MAGELILYTTEDGAASVRLRAEGGSVWITQAEMAALFQTTPQNITLHVKAIYAEGELQPEATCKEHLQVRQEGGRQVRRALKHYNLDMILAVGYGVFYAEGVSPEFLAHYLNSSYFAQLLARETQGGTRKALRFSALAGMEVDLPKRTDQEPVCTPAVLHRTGGGR